MYSYRTFAILFATSVIFLGYSGDAYAGTPQPDNYPMVPDAFVNYNSITNESTITWDFSDLPDYTDGALNGQPAKCAIKADFGFSSNPIDDPSVKINGMMAREYSPTYDPSGYNALGPLQSTDNSDTDIQGEEIPCTGKLTMDFDDIIGQQIFHDDPDYAPVQWNIPGHVNNTSTHVGVEPFISFYIMNSDGDFETDDSTVVDEILILYHPQAAEIDQDTIDWACGFNDPNPKNQIAVGNVLFIDQTGIRGTGGPNNCDEVQELENSEYCCTFLTVTISSSGGSSTNPNARPTFGIDYQTFEQIVDNGLTINNATFNVLDNYWTHIPMQNATIGEVQNFTATVYAPKTLHVMEFLFGVPEVGAWGEAESTVALIFDYNGDNIISNSTYNKDDIIIDYTTLSYSSSKTLCTADDTVPICDRISIEFVFNESPLYEVLAMQAIDNKGRNTILYFNDGLDVDGESLNPPVQKVILSDIPHQGLQTVERIDKAEDIWMTLDENEPVSLYQQNSFGTFIPIEWKPTEKPMDNVSSIMNRDHSYFGLLVDVEQQRAQHTLDNFVSNMK